MPSLEEFNKWKQNDRIEYLLRLGRIEKLYPIRMNDFFRFIEWGLNIILLTSILAFVIFIATKSTVMFYTVFIVLKLLLFAALVMLILDFILSWINHSKKKQLLNEFQEMIENKENKERRVFSTSFTEMKKHGRAKSNSR